MRVEIERLAFGGSGVARKDGKVYFVKGGLPGDSVDIRVISDKGRFAEGVVERIARPSPERVEPQCEVFHTCGGCQLQDLGYSAQLREKENILGETVRRIGGVKDVRPETIFPSPSGYGYRRRVLLSAWYSSGCWHVGYYREMSRTNVRIETCPVADAVINRAISRLSKVLASVEDPRYPLDRIYLSSDGERAHITLLPRAKSGPASLGALARHLRRHEETENVSVQGEEETGFELSVGGSRFIVTPSLFTQSNAAVNEALIRTVIEWAGLKGNETVLDLYSGAGNFSLSLAKSSKRIISVEVSKKAVELAKKSAGLSGVSNIDFHNVSCGEYLNSADAIAGSVDIVVLDPPREGAKEAVPGIARLSPGKVIYISCDPATLSRDIRSLKDAGYRLERLKPFDMFPQTYHIESLSLLVRA